LQITSNKPESSWSFPSKGRSKLLKPTLLTVGLLYASNLFMTFAWYGHLRTMKDSPWWTAALLSWGIALAEYLLMVPANRIGFTGGLSGAQLKIIQECVTLVVFVPFMMLFLGEKWRWDFLWAFFCILGAVFFILRPDRA
jgi:uncharacterized protein (DUF486 family)